MSKLLTDYFSKSISALNPKRIDIDRVQLQSNSKIDLVLTQKQEDHVLKNIDQVCEYMLDQMLQDYYPILAQAIQRLLQRDELL